MSIPRVLRSVWLVRALILIVSHALAVQFSQNATTDTVPADVIIAAPSGEGNFPADFTGENNGVAIGTVITWSAPQNIAGDSDVITGGSLVGAFNVGDGGVGAATVNGVTFNPFALNSSGGPVSSGTVASGGVSFTLSTTDLFASTNTTYGAIPAAAPFSNLSAGYQTLLRSGTQVFGFPPDPGEFKLTLSGLTLNQQYQFQWFANLSGPGAQLHYARDEFGNSVGLNDNTTNVNGGLGQFAIGDFVATTTSLIITFRGDIENPENYAMINGFLLRAVPEPTGTVLALLGLGVLLCRRTRANAAWRQSFSRCKVRRDGLA